MVNEVKNLDLVKEKVVMVYDLKTQGVDFKADFNSLKRVKKILDERENNSYRKIDLVLNKSNQLLLIYRTANFETSVARMQAEVVSLD